LPVVNPQWKVIFKKIFKEKKKKQLLYLECKVSRKTQEEDTPRILQSPP
jgi:hypothetical protein